MGRHRPSGSYGHSITRLGPGEFRLEWTIDRYVKDARTRFPTSQNRDTDLRGAKRFAKKWGCEVPGQEPL
ncbi:hypothetical protein LCGC14_0663300 [marine sediment metagenome]|uniref:Uncharacterized protein n=1 Tax=marine sediment metagenome TaxID=412755 RepID=A0A0F9RD45_9ZZZZ